MRKTAFTAFTCLATALLAPGALAQDAATKKPRELQKLEHMLGKWTGSGKYYQGPETEGSAWTSATEARWVLGGQFMLEDMKIVMEGLPPGMNDTLEFRTLYGWDAQRQKIVGHQFSNMGGGKKLEPYWTDGKIVTMSMGYQEGEPYIERSTVDLEDHSFEMVSAGGSGPVFTHVEGSMQKAETGFDATSEAADVAFVPPPEAMTMLEGLAGSFTINGKAAPAPGAELAPFTGEVRVERMFGGHAMAVHLPPGGMRPETFGHMYWDPVPSCYRYFVANAMGHLVEFEGQLLEKTLVLTANTTVEGTPLVERIVLELGPDGGPAGIAVDMLHGKGGIARVMEARYTRQGAAPARTVEAKFTPGSCCARAEAAGTACTHPCCVEAAKAGKVCAACN